MRVITFNINGLRSAWKKGLGDFISSKQPEIILLQETRISQKDLEKISPFQDYPYQYYNHSDKAGYSGTAIISKLPFEVINDISQNLPVQNEGRYIFANINDKLTIGNLYLPSGTSSQERQELKLDVLESLTQTLKQIQSPMLISGDMNLTRADIDLKNFKGNKEKPGCTTVERGLFETLLTENNLIDCHRTLEPDNWDIYTWWTYRAGAFAKNVGWRIDYHLASQELSPMIRSCQLISTPRISDHAAVMLEIEI